VKRWLLMLMVVFLSWNAADAATKQQIDMCLASAAQKYDIHKDLLAAIAEVESGMDPQALGKNKDGTEDIGLMQINSRWLPVLAKYGVQRRDLFDPCVSAHVGAWILAQNIARYGNTWRAVGAYNAASEEKRLAYAQRVAFTMKRIHDEAFVPVPSKKLSKARQARLVLRVIGEQQNT